LLSWHNCTVSWEVEYTEEFGKWWDSLKETEQGSMVGIYLTR